MGDPRLLGVDIGGTASKAALYGLDGTLYGVSRVPYVAARTSDGGMEYDPETLASAACTAVRQTLEQTGALPADIAAVGIDGMISGTLGVDVDGQPTTPYTTTLDTRYEPYLGAAIDRGGQLLCEISGSIKPTVGPKAMWMREAMPDAYARTACWLSAGAYVGMRLTGLRGDAGYVDRSQLWAYGLANARTGEWSAELCWALGVSEAQLPRIVSSSDVIGAIDDEASRRTSLLAGTPVIAGLGDTPAGLLGAGITRPGDTGDGAGTYSTLATALDGYAPAMRDSGVHVIAGALPESWYALTFVDGGGLLRSWCLRLLLGEDPTPEAMERLGEQAGAVAPGSRGVIFLLPRDAGRQPSSSLPWSRGGWIGATLDHGRPEFYRALMEAIAYRQADAMERIEQDHGVDAGAVSTYGGGAGDPRWNQIKADVAQRSYEHLGNSEVTSLGAALMAGVAVHAIADPAAVARTVRTVQGRFDPDRSVAAEYRELRDVARSVAPGGAGQTEREVVAR